MSSLKLIASRHGWDRWKDAGFIAAAVLMTALAIGSVTTKATGDPGRTAWNTHVEVIDGDLAGAR